MRQDDRQRYLPLALLGSLAVHLSPLLLLLNWSAAPAEPTAPIPVQLVFEQPPPPPAPDPTPPPRGRLASVDIGERTAEPLPANPAPEPTEAQLAMAAAPPQPQSSPARQLVSALPKPVPEPEPLGAARDVPSMPVPFPPASAVKPAAPQPVAARPPPRPRPTSVVPGPDATRDEYLAYCEMLIRRHLDRVPPSFFAGRTGKAIFSLLVLADGTIAGVGIKLGSGYRDIDVQAQQLLVAVRRFPPLPQWFQGPDFSVNFHLVFRDGAVR